MAKYCGVCRFLHARRCVASGANIVLSRLAIGDLGTQYFADRGVFCAGRELGKHTHCQSAAVVRHRTSTDNLWIDLEGCTGAQMELSGTSWCTKGATECARRMPYEHRFVHATPMRSVLFYFRSSSMVVGLCPGNHAKTAATLSSMLQHPGAEAGNSTEQTLFAPCCRAQAWSAKPRPPAHTKMTPKQLLRCKQQALSLTRGWQ
eukprot:scaffold27542_cov21-Tisochrysis_lutea.AAC.1